MFLWTSDHTSKAAYFLVVFFLGADFFLAGAFLAVVFFLGADFLAVVFLAACARRKSLSEGYSDWRENSR